MNEKIRPAPPDKSEPTTIAKRDNPRAREKRPPRRAIDGGTIAEVAQLCAKLLTEAEACRRIGVNPATWRNWKSRNRNSEKFAELLEAFRANRIDDLLRKIENAADGVGMKQPDWRAAAFLLTVTDRNRFSSNAPAGEMSAPFHLLPPGHWERILASVVKSPELKPVVEVKQLPETI